MYRTALLALMQIASIYNAKIVDFLALIVTYLLVFNVIVCIRFIMPIVMRNVLLDFILLIVIVVVVIAVAVVVAHVMRYAKYANQPMFVLNVLQDIM